MKKYLLIILSSLFFLPNIYACTYEIKAELRKLASNVNFNLDYDIVNDEASFKLTITGVDSELYVVDDDNHRYDGGQDIVINNIKGGTKAKYRVRSVYYDFCINKDLYVKSISTPYYNRYYNDDLCLKHKNSDLCYRWRSTDMSYDDLKKRIAILERETPVVPDEPDVKKNSKFYIVYIVIGSVVIFGGSIVVIRRRNIGF